MISFLLSFIGNAKKLAYLVNTGTRWRMLQPPNARHHPPGHNTEQHPILLMTSRLLRVGCIALLDGVYPGMRQRAQTPFLAFENELYAGIGHHAFIFIPIRLVCHLIPNAAVR